MRRCVDVLWMAVLVCESMHVLRNLASNIAHTGQINFQERFKTPSLDVLKKYMSERIYKASERPSVSQTYPDLNLKSLGKARMLQKHRMNVLLRTKSNGRSPKPRK